MEWPEEEDYNPGVPVFKGVPLVISISSEDSEDDMIRRETTLTEKVDEDGKKQYSQSRISKKNRKKRTLSESSDNDSFKNYPEEEKRTDVDVDVIDLTYSFGELSSLENTPTKMEQDPCHSQAKDAAKAQLLFSDKESGSSETDSEQGNLKEDTDSKKRKRRKQKKIGEDLWINTEREEVECLPKEINGINVYIVNRKDEKDVKESLEDGRKWRKDCLTNWKGREKVRYADCRGSYKCNNSACPFLEEYGIRNTRQWKKRAGKVFCQGCGDTGIYVPCNARRYLCHEKRRVLVFHCGFHTCPVSNHVTKDKEDIENIIK